MTKNLPMNKYKIAQWLHAAWLLPTLWLVGCSTDNGAEAASDAASTPIVFTVSTEAAPEQTRGYLLNELDGEFGLFCASYDDDEWGDDGQALNFMYNELVFGDGDKWTTSEGYFVPKTDNLKFFAYYPFYYDVNDGACPLTMYGNNTTAYPFPSFTYVMPDCADDQLDLMYAISDQVHANNKGKLGTVHLHFRHLLTAVTISAKSNESCTLKRITLKNLYKKGEFEFKEGNELRADANYDYGNGFGDVYVDLNMKLKSAYKTADAGKSFMLILQPKDANGNIIMSQEAKMEIEIDASGKKYTFSKKLMDPNAQDYPNDAMAPLRNALIASKNTLLRVSVESLQRVKLSATITDWGHGANFDGAVSDQPTLEMESVILDWDDEDNNGNSTTVNFVTGPHDTNP